MKSMLAPEIYTEKFTETLAFYKNLGFEPQEEAFGFRRMDGFVPLILKGGANHVLYVDPNGIVVDIAEF